MPVDGGVSFYVDVAADTGLAGESNFLARVAEDFQSEQWVQPLPETFKDAAGGCVFLALTEDDAAAAALSEAHAVQVFMGAFVNLHTVFERHFAQVFTRSDVYGELFIDKPDLGHGDRAFCGDSRNGSVICAGRNPSPGISVIPDAAGQSRH